MTRLIIDASGQVQPEVVPISEDHPILLGRAPDTGKVDRAAELSGAVESRVVASPSVSGNHALAWLDGEHVHVVDLESRNGTWIKLPPGAVVSVPRDRDVELRLSSAVRSAPHDETPEVPRYLGKLDFGSALAQSVRAWLAIHGITSRVWSAPRDKQGEPPVGVSAISLANGDVLYIAFERTAESSFQERFAQLYRFVNVQNALYTAEESTRSDGMILASTAMRQLHRRVVELAMQGLPSLILLGPTGTGKERLAQAYHRHLGRNGALVAINCATLSRDRVVADLFGAEAGAYTDAKRAMIGAVERADGGTLLLDELGELPLDVQPMLLRFLETGEYQRLGATGRPRFSDVRVVAATNRDLRQMARDGAFREDLFFRLALEILEVPPLSDRFEDVESYLRSRMLGETSIYEALDEQAIALLRAYPWPGNFRELMNLARRLPRPAPDAKIEQAAVRRALEAGSLAPLRITPAHGMISPAAVGTWLEWLNESAVAFTKDLEHGGPTTWGDITVFVEQFLKPWALAHLGAVAQLGSLAEVTVNQVADAVKADRGTVMKQLRRYFESRR